MFERMPPGVRKVVLSTNIAETSVTIDDVVFVIDCGRHKENRFDPVNRMPQLMETWVSQANSRQRRGRAGRVRPGHAFFLFTRERKKNMAEYQTPEMLRVPLDELCLQIKLLDLGEVAEFLGRAIEPPRVRTPIQCSDLERHHFAKHRLLNFYGGWRSVRRLNVGKNCRRD